MSNDGSMGLDEIVFDASNLYREERITDLKAGVLRQLVPIKDDGTVDEERPVLLGGQTQVMSQAGPLPLDFALEATTIADAIKEFLARLRRHLRNSLKKCGNTSASRRHASWFLDADLRVRTKIRSFFKRASIGKRRRAHGH